MAKYPTNCRWNTSWRIYVNCEIDLYDYLTVEIWRLGLFEDEFMKIVAYYETVIWQFFY